MAALSFEDGKTKLTTQRIKKRVRRFYEEHKENFLAAFGVYQYGNRCSWRSAAYPAYVSLPASGIVWFCQKLCQNGKLVPFHRALPEAFGALDGEENHDQKGKNYSYAVHDPVYGNWFLVYGQCACGTCHSGPCLAVSYDLFHQGNPYSRGRGGINGEERQRTDRIQKAEGAGNGWKNDGSLLQKQTWQESI